jgi:hypothetical protein
MKLLHRRAGIKGGVSFNQSVLHNRFASQSFLRICVSHENATRSAYLVGVSHCHGKTVLTRPSVQARVRHR